MQDGGAARVSDARHVNPLVEQVVNGHLLLKLTRHGVAAGTWVKARLQVVEAHATASTEQLHATHPPTSYTTT